MKTSQEKIPLCAIVIGGSIAGKLAARVLSDYYDRVIVIDQDLAPQGPHPRKGTPQSHHTHALLQSGENALKQLFPGIFERLVKDGARQFDYTRDISWRHHGFHFVRFDSGLTSHFQSRPLLEWHVHQQTTQHSNIQWEYETRVISYLFNEAKTSVIGVEIENNQTKERQIWNADLVVDTAGSASRTPEQLKLNGYDGPKQQEIKINLVYSTRIYEFDPEQSRNWEAAIVYPSPPAHTRGGMIFPIEGNRWSVTLVGFGDDNHPPSDEEGFLEFARSLTHPVIYDHLTQSTPISDIHLYRFPSQTFRNYDKLARIPSGLLIMGDAFCRFNPVYAQGISVTCLEAVELQRMLREASSSQIPFDSLPRKLHKSFAKIINPIWFTVSADAFLYKTTIGKKPSGLGFLQWYVWRIFRLAEYDKEVYSVFNKVLHLLASPAQLYHPKILFKVLMLKKSKG